MRKFLQAHFKGAMTELCYWNDTYLFQLDDVQVVSIAPTSEDNKDGKYDLILEKTIFHPQGGGQPSDTGKIGNESTEFSVEKVRKIDDQVHHFGDFVKGGADSFASGTSVSLSIHEENRKLYARLHSAGHLLDSAVQKLGLDFEPGKGYHFPNSPYVEYKGTIPPADRNAVKEKLNEEANKLIQENSSVEVKIITGQDLESELKEVPSYIDKEKPCRVVKMAGVSCPCGGTHVKQVADINKIDIYKLATKKGVTKLSYRVS